MADQATIQKFIQQAQGTHTAGQANVPSSAGTGNPNGVYNWSSYAVTPGATPQFNLQTQQVPASDPNYTPPFAADPYLAGVLSGVPQAPRNEHVDRILGRLFAGTPAGGWGAGPSNGAPGPGTGNPAPGPGPGTGNPSQPQPGYQPPGGSWFKPIGPISGPIANNPHNLEGNFNNAQPNTNLNDSGLGRTQALDWLRMRYPGGTGSFDGVIGGNADGSQGSGALARIGSSISNALGALGIDLGSEARTLWQNATGQNGLGSFLATAADLLLGPGAGSIIRRMDTLSPEQRQQAEATMQEQLNQALANMSTEARQQAAATLDQAIRDAGTNAAMDVISQRTGRNGQISSEESRRRAEAYYNSRPEMTASEWRQTQESMDWNNLWYGNNRNAAMWNNSPGRSIPSSSNMDDFINNISANALAWEEQMRNRWTREK